MRLKKKIIQPISDAGVSEKRDFNFVGEVYITLFGMELTVIKAVIVYSV